MAETSKGEWSKEKSDLPPELNPENWEIPSEERVSAAPADAAASAQTNDTLDYLKPENWTGTTAFAHNLLVSAKPAESSVQPESKPEVPSAPTVDAPIITLNGDLTTGGTVGSEGYFSRESETFVDKDGRVVTRDMEGVDGEVTLSRDESYYGRDGNDKATIAGRNSFADMGPGDDMVAVNMNAHEIDHENNQDGSVLRGGEGHDIAFIKITEGGGAHHETTVNAEGESVTTFTDFGAPQSTGVSFTGFEEFRVSVDSANEKGADPVKSMKQHEINSGEHDKALAAANELREKMNVDFIDDGKGDGTMDKNEPGKEVKSDEPEIAAAEGRAQ